MGLFSGALSLASGILPGGNLVRTAVGLASSFASTSGTVAPKNAKDKARAASALSQLSKAINGDLAAAQQMYAYMTGDTPAYGKQQFTLAWRELEAKNPAIAAQVTGRTGEQPINAAGHTPSTAERLGDELERLRDAARRAAAEAAGRILSGTTAAAQDAIDPTESHFTIPTDRGQLLTIGVAVIAALVILWLVFRK